MLQDIFNVTNVVTGSLSAFVAILMWNVRKHVARLERLEREAATRGDLQELKENTERLHKENIDRFDRIERTGSETHRRIDDIFKLLYGRRYDDGR